MDFDGPLLRWRDYSLDDAEQSVHDRFAEFFELECPTDRVRAAEPLGFDPALWERVTSFGALALAVPQTRGGHGAGMVGLVLAAEAHGRALAPVPFPEVTVATRLLGRLDGADDVFKDAISGKKLVVLALQPTTPRTPQLVAGAPVADVVIALDGDELIAVTAVTRPTHLTNLGRVPLAWWSPDGNERVALANGESARASFALARREWQLTTAAALTGLAAGALRIGAEYAAERRQFGVPIGTFQAVSHALADVEIAVECGRALVRKAAWYSDNEPEHAAVWCIAAFVHACEAAEKATQVAVHTLGGRGVTSGTDIELFFRRAKGWAVLGGDPQAELLTLADELFGPVEDGAFPPRAASASETR